MIEPREQGHEALQEFQRQKKTIEKVVLYSDEISGILESHDSSDKKLIYQIPFDQ
jgi:hypothetical protein